MTPDTSSYMIAGLLVIFCGIAGYVVSLIFRHWKISKELKYYETNEGNNGNG